jgi:hypothetical protein
MQREHRTHGEITPEVLLKNEDKVLLSTVDCLQRYSDVLSVECLRKAEVLPKSVFVHILTMSMHIQELQKVLRHQADSAISPRGATQKRTEVRMPQVLPWRDEDSTARWLEEQGLSPDHELPAICVKVSVWEMVCGKSV